MSTKRRPVEEIQTHLAAIKTTPTYQRIFQYLQVPQQALKIQLQEVSFCPLGFLQKELNKSLKFQVTKVAENLVKESTQVRLQHNYDKLQRFQMAVHPTCKVVVVVFQVIQIHNYFPLIVLEVVILVPSDLVELECYLACKNSQMT